ncbi:hypothetical protein [Dictyobacter formicarum]|nr:hypothetical protein [Dictyobacter formicarum]
MADNVRFYQHHGFQIVASGKDPGSLIPFWSMMRGPRQPGD